MKGKNPTNRIKFNNAYKNSSSDMKGKMFSPDPVNKRQISNLISPTKKDVNLSIKSLCSENEFNHFERCDLFNALKYQNRVENVIIDDEDNKVIEIIDLNNNRKGVIFNKTMTINDLLLKFKNECTDSIFFISESGIVHENKQMLINLDLNQSYYLKSEK